MARRLIVGYDGSPNGDDALALGSVLAECLAARPLVATVLPFNEHLVGSDRLGPAVEEATEPIFDRARERFGDVEIDTRAIVEGSPARALNDLAEGVDPVALVIGSSRRGAIGRVLLGSVGSALLSGAPCPIAVAPHGYAAADSRRLLRIAVAVNGSEEAWPALAAAAGLAGRLHAGLAVLAVVEPIRLSHGGQYPAIDPATYRDASERELGRVLERAVELVPDEIPAERRLLEGDPAEVLSEAAADFDLLVVGSRAFGPIRRALLGSVSAQLMRAAPCPVLLLPRSAGNDPLGLAEVGGAGIQAPG
ncbi:MAG TPA: universal stress protein [Solirubrobacterales bacterium]|nr:universal stress protein [Solirubrobacterales bacterium]